VDTIADLIDAAKARTGVTYTEIGERLDRSKQLVANWRSGNKVPTDGDVMALARMAGEDMDKWLAIAQAARSEGDAKVRWQQIAKRLAATTALLALVVLPALSERAQAATGWAEKSAQVGIMRN
jgi:transcriptional regulator with XRE-family HTH domain